MRLTKIIDDARVLVYRLRMADGKTIAEQHEREIREQWTAEDIERAHYLDESDPDVKQALDEVREMARVKQAKRQRAVQPQNK